MRKESKYCDYCEQPVKLNNRKVQNENGFTICIGYSKGGWGNRKDFVRDHSAEICDYCFEQVKNKAKEMKELIKKLKQSKFPEY